MHHSLENFISHLEHLPIILVYTKTVSLKQKDTLFNELQIIIFLNKNYGASLNCVVVPY